ncbi:HPr family phosphocarrier protein [Clostridium aestuarii]|uniref:HPr family phosphocarrier protein n=1 Tax=Clostridium aestuarii TaxID=338193 RepID=A0ABT4CWQ2_9CLOT|nr:HPr family phosphocarrier protein [Clostridium aestuarii]
MKVNSKDGAEEILASMISKESKKYDSTINMFKENSYCNADNTNDVLNMGLNCGDEVLIVAEGWDELQAIQEMKNIIENNFDV